MSLLFLCLLELCPQNQVSTFIPARTRGFPWGQRTGNAPVGALLRACPRVSVMGQDSVLNILELQSLSVEGLCIASSQNVSAPPE
ncbi:hypothetical protein Y1Q_0016967 [Alligator mississippiensis]|uniref:Uncharacterized protein n=1 Tax=Alligator mississippiensis TaxID=8496 RepID=A0A151NRB2_ALLMI|nr:hypothetical protein Y1Q_0016967 [Alligator mississippiensis]